MQQVKTLLREDEYLSFEASNLDRKTWLTSSTRALVGAMYTSRTGVDPRSSENIHSRMMYDLPADVGADTLTQSLAEASSQNAF